MKERIVIPKDKIKVLTSCSRFPANGYFTFYKEDVEVEQVPETFEELKELCKDLESKSITIYDGAITIDFPSINGGFNFYIYITEKEIDINSSVFAQNRTIPQLWAFIKSLIGEE